MDTKIGKYLRSKRLSYGGKGFWSLRSVAKRSGISDSYLSQLETGQVKQPLPEVLKGLALALKVSYAELMEVVGYLPPAPPQGKFYKIPILGEVPAGKINEIDDQEVTWLNIDKTLVQGHKQTDLFSLVIKGDCLIDAKIFDGDHVIVSRSAKLKNGDIAVVRIDDEFTCKRVFLQDDLLILETANSKDQRKWIKDSKKNQFLDVIGKIVGSYRKFK